MKVVLSAAVATLVLAALAPAEAWANPQQERMKRCNQEAKSQVLKGGGVRAASGTEDDNAHAHTSPAARMRAISFVVLNPSRKGRNSMRVPPSSNAVRSPGSSFSREA